MLFSKEIQTSASIIVHFSEQNIHGKLGKIFTVPYLIDLTLCSLILKTTLILSSPRTGKGGTLMSYFNLYAHRTLYLSCESVYHSALHAHELQRIHEQNKGYIPSVKSKTTKYYRYHRISP